jgi:predicted nucleic acid-binding protein
LRRFVLADTGPLYAAVDRDDQHHSRAQAEIARLAEDRLAVAILRPTLMEAYSLVLYRLGARVAHDWLREVDGGALLVQPGVEDYTDAHALVQGFPDQAITLFDALVASAGRRLGTSIWTYDHHFDMLRASVWRPS